MPIPLPFTTSKRQHGHHRPESPDNTQANKATVSQQKEEKLHLPECGENAFIVQDGKIQWKLYLSGNGINVTTRRMKLKCSIYCTMNHQKDIMTYNGDVKVATMLQNYIYTIKQRL